MASSVHLLLCPLVVLTLPRPTLPCKEMDTPLLLTPYLDEKKIDKARFLSQVDPDCLEDFVPNSHAGFLTADKELGNHLFFWFFPATDNKNAPLMLWLNGGPTITSMRGLFWENGPMVVTKKGKRNNCNKEETESSSGYSRRKYSWTGHFSMLYVDNPVGVGYSFSDSGEKGWRDTQEGYTKDLASFMIQFLTMFHEYKHREIYFGGQSYAGKYISSLAYEIHRQAQDGAVDFNFTGIYLGAPWLDQESQGIARYDYYYSMGEMSLEDMLKSKRLVKEMFDLSSAGTFDVTEIFKYLTLPSIPQSHRDNLVTREDDAHREIATLMSTKKIKSAVHAGDRNFSASYNGRMYHNMLRDFMFVTTVPKLKEIMDNYKVLIFNGNYDATVSSPMVEAALMVTPWKSQKEYNVSSKTIWYRGNDVIGYYTKVGNFCRVVINGAGHQVPHDQPEVTYETMRQFVSNGCVENFNLTSSPSRSNVNFQSFMLMGWSLILFSLLH